MESIMVNDNSTISGAILRAEFAHVCKLVRDATGAQCDPYLSYRIGTLWKCRNAAGDDIAECDPRSGQVTQFDNFVLPVAGLLERVADLRRSGFSSQCIMNWLGHVRARDPLIEASISFQLACKVQERLQRLAHHADAWQLVRPGID
jgi:hypothetical protein